MGLSGRKIKQRIPQDPRNLSWADDASRFGSKYLSKLGFDHTDKNATLGVSGVGLTQHLKVHHKLDALGIGAQHTEDPGGIAWKQNRDFENLLKRLNADSEDLTRGKADAVPIDGFQPARVDAPTADVTTVGSETEGRGKEREVEKERKRKKKRLRDDGESAETKERTSKKRKNAKSTIAASNTGLVEASPSSSTSPTPETVANAIIPHRRGRAHRARFIASKRLTATSSVAVAEILGIPSSPVTPLSVSGVATPEVTPQAEADEHEYLTVSSKSVAEYFKQKIRLTVSKPSGSETETDEAPRGGIGSRPKFCSHDGMEEGGGLRGGLGMGLLAKMSEAETVMVNPVQEETPEGKGKKREERIFQSEDDKGEANHKPKKKGKKKTQTVPVSY